MKLKYYNQLIKMHRKRTRIKELPCKIRVHRGVCNRFYIANIYTIHLKSQCHIKKFWKTLALIQR